MRHRQSVGVGLAMAYLSDGELRICLTHTDEGLLYGSIYGVEVDDDIFRLVDKVPENRINATCGILNNDTFINGSIHQLGKTFTRLVKEIDILVPEKLVRTGLSEFSIASFGIANGYGVCAKTAMVQVVPFRVEEKMRSHAMTIFVGHGRELVVESRLGVAMERSPMLLVVRTTLTNW